MQPDFPRFVRSWLPEPPARVLEIGCGSGELALGLARDGHDVIAIDPNAPSGPLFRRETLEEHTGPGPYDAIVASLSLHHVDDVDAAASKLAGLLRPGGVLVLDEYAREDLDDEPTSRWYYHQRRALAAARGEDDVPPTWQAWREEWLDHHGGIHTGLAVRAALAERFDERLFARLPFLFTYRLDPSLELAERRLIEEGAVRPVGFRYVGMPLGET